MTTYELKPMYDRAKSFYGKAVVTVNDRGDAVLRSYDTDVCMITASGEFLRFWEGYSVTTMRHVNDFLAQASIFEGGKKFWDACAVRRYSWVNFYANKEQPA